MAQYTKGPPAEQKPAPPKREFDPTEGMSTYEKFMAGMGKAFADTGRWVGNKVGLVSDAEIAEAKRLDTALMDTTAGKVGNALGDLAVTAPLGGLAVKAAVKTAQAARAAVAAGTIEAGATAVVSGVKVTAGAVAKETAKAVAKDTLRAAGTAAKATAKVTAKTATVATTGYSAVTSWTAQDKGANARLSAEDRANFTERGIDASAIEKNEQLKIIDGQQQKALLTGGAAMAGLAVAARISPLGRLLSLTKAVAGMATIGAGATVASTYAADKVADLEIAQGLDKSDIKTGVSSAAVVSAAGAAAVPAGRNWIKEGLNSFGAAGWGGRALKALGITGAVGGIALSALDFEENVDTIKAAKLEEAKINAQHAARVAAEQPSVLDKGTMQEIVANASPAPRVMGPREGFVPGVPAQPSEVTKVYNEHATRAPKMAKPAVAIAAVPTTPTAGDGFHAPASTYGQLSVTPEMQAALHVDFSRVPEVAAAAPPPEAIEPDDGSALARMLDAGAQLMADNQPAAPEAVEPEERRMIAQASVRPPTAF